MLQTTTPDQTESCSPDAPLTPSPSPDRRLPGAVLLAGWLLVGIGLLTAGPLLSTHETIIGQSARQILQSGDWIVPRYLDAPFLVKPPLTPWLCAAAGSLLWSDGGTGQLAGAAAARLPSLLATFLTIGVIYWLAASMYGRRTGRTTAFVYATSAGTLAFALNATAEALLTLFCTWMFAEFWWWRHASGGRRRLHQLRFFIAFGLAMMAKAPMPLMIVAVPLAFWWYTERAVRLWSTGKPGALTRGSKRLGRDAIVRTRMAFTDLGLWWGLPLGMAFLLAWMWAASRHVPYIWRLWHTEYFDRIHDNELWSSPHGPWYYLPVLLGLTAPWLLSMPEALIAPFLNRYRQDRRGLFYAWSWVLPSVALLSSMQFKQDYYLVPVLPGCALILGPVLHRMFFHPSAPLSPALRRTVAGLIIALLAVVPVVCWAVFKDEVAGRTVRELALLLFPLGMAFAGGTGLAAWLFLRGRKSSSFHMVGVAGLAVFSVIWVGAGWAGHQSHEYTALVQGFRQAGVPDTIGVYWADSVPDGRAAFYGNLRIRQLGDPFELRAGLRGDDKDSVLMEMGGKICTLLEGPRIYMVLERDRFQLLRSIFQPKATILFEVDRVPQGRGEEDWVVITNARPS